jgi:protoporphyrinogen oxidase
MAGFGDKGRSLVKPLNSHGEPMNDASPLNGDRCDLCVIGGGISGLAMAQLAASRLHLQVKVLDKAPQPGGCLATVPIGPTEAPEGWLELGAHTCYNSYTSFLDLMAATDLLARTVSRKSLGFKIMTDGVLRSIPACLNILEAALSLPRLLLGEKKAGQTAAAYYARILGKRNWAKVMHPMLNAVASQETEAFPADALFKPRSSRRKDVLRSFALREGLGGAARTLAEQPGIECLTGQEAVNLERTGDGFMIRLRSGKVIQARHLALAVPADAARILLAGAFPEAAALLGQIETRTVRSLGVVFSVPLAHLPRLTGLVLPGGPCFSAVSADTFPVPGKRAWTFHFDGTRMADDPEAMLDYACKVMGCNRGDVASHTRRDHAMPAVRMGHEAWVVAMDRNLEGTDVMLLGNYLSGLSIEDCVNRAHHEFERVLQSRPGPSAIPAKA